MNAQHPRRYRKRPVVIEAMQFDGTNAQAIVAWVGSSAVIRDGAYDQHTLVIVTLEGEMTVTKDDYVIKGVQSEFYPCKESIFLATYEPEATEP